MFVMEKLILRYKTELASLIGFKAGSVWLSKTQKASIDLEVSILKRIIIDLEDIK